MHHVSFLLSFSYMYSNLVKHKHIQTFSSNLKVKAYKDCLEINFKPRIEMELLKVYTKPTLGWEVFLKKIIITLFNKLEFLPLKNYNK